MFTGHRNRSATARWPSEEAIACYRRISGLAFLSGQKRPRWAPSPHRQYQTAPAVAQDLRAARTTWES